MDEVDLKDVSQGITCVLITAEECPLLVFHVSRQVNVISEPNSFQRILKKEYF